MAATILLILVLFFGYAVAMQLVIDLSAADSDLDTRDWIYFAIHVGTLAVSGLAGFLLGKWLSGLGFAYAVLVVSVLAVSMVFAQLGSRQINCNSEAEVLRHWHC